MFWKCLILIAISLNASASNSSLTEVDLDNCKAKQLEAKALELLKSKIIGQIYLQDNLESFALKVIVPHLMEGVILLSDDYLYCHSMKEEGKHWKSCLQGRLTVVESKYFERLYKCFNK